MPCSLRWEPGCGAGRSNCSRDALRMGAPGLGLARGASSGLWSLILGASIGKEAGAWSLWRPPVPAQRPSPQPLGILLPRVSVSAEHVPGILGISPLFLGGPGRSPAWAPPPQAVLVSRKGRVKALSRRSEAEQSEEQGQQPEWGGQRGRTQSLPQQDVLSLKKPSQVPTNPPDRLAATSLLPAA